MASVMIVKYRCDDRNRRLSMFSVRAPDMTRLCLVHADGSMEQQIADAIFSAAARSSSSSAWARDFADEVKDLVTRSTSHALPVSLAAVSISMTEAQVAWAGDIRVHLLEDHRVVAQTTDGVPGNESPQWIKSTYGDIDLDSHRTMLTHTLTDDRPLDRISWRLKAGNSRIFVCSSAFHRHSSPDGYLRAALEDAVLDENAAVLLAGDEESFRS